MRRFLCALVAVVLASASTASASPDTFYGNVVGGTLSGNGAGITNLDITRLTPLGGNVVVCTTSGGLLTTSCGSAALVAGSASLGGALSVASSATFLGNVVGAGVYANGGLQTSVNLGPAIATTFPGASTWGGLGMNASNGNSELDFVNTNNSAWATATYQWNGIGYVLQQYLTSGGVLFLPRSSSTINIAGLTASNCVGTDPSKNLVSNSYCVQTVSGDGANTTSTGGPNPQITLTATQAAAHTWSATQTFSARPIASGLSTRGYGATSGRSATASFTMPNDGLTHIVGVHWKIAVVGDTGDITGCAGGTITNFQHMNSAGYTSGNYTTDAFFTTTGAGQSVSCTLSSGGGTTTGAGLWWADDTAQ